MELTNIKKTLSNKTYSIASLLAIICSLTFHIMDIIVYPDIKSSLLIIRVITALFIAINWYIMIKVQKKYSVHLAIVSCIVLSFGISLMCFISGDGFASPYYAGILMVFALAMMFFHFEPWYYRTMLIIIIVQHFALLFCIPWTIKDVTVTLFFMMGLAYLCATAHALIFKMMNEIQTLQGLLPICMYCKKIRTDAGTWDKIEKYISERANVDFSHGICSECIEKHFPETEEEKNNL